jgi:hypothetical protein
MSRKSFVLVFLMIFSTAISAQRFNGGIIAGGNVSQLDGDNQPGYHKFGYQAGAFVSLHVSQHSSFQLEMEYIQKGSRYNGDTLTHMDPTFIFRFHYVEIPLLYQYSFAKRQRFSFETGPAIDVLLGSYQESPIGMEVGPQDIMTLRSITLAGIFGFSAFLTNHLKANFRFNYSLLSITPYNNYPPNSRHILFEIGQYNNVMSLSLLWYFKARE